MATGGPHAGRLLHAIARILFVLLLAGPMLMAGGPASADGGGQLAVEAVPATAGPDNPIVDLQVVNTGTDPVTGVTLTTESPQGVRPTVEPNSVAALQPGTSFAARVRIAGAPQSRPAAIVVVVSGTTKAGNTVALASIGLVQAEPAVSLTLVGNTRLTDASPADLLAVVTNPSDAEEKVTVRATAEPQIVRLAASGHDVAAAPAGTPVEITVPARETGQVHVRVEARGSLRRGAAGLVVTASVPTANSATRVEVVASRELEVALSADALPAALGGLSVLLIPGLVGIWALLAVLAHDLRRIGVVTAGAGAQIWDNKLWLLAALGVSVTASALYALFGLPGLLDTYTVEDVAWLTAACGAVGAASGALWVWQHRRSVPAVTPTIAPLKLLEAAAKEDRCIKRPVYVSSLGMGLLVHTDRGAKVLTPPVNFTELDLGKDITSGQLDAVVFKVRASAGGHLLRYAQEPGFITGPRAAIDAMPSGRQMVPIIRYNDAEEDDS